MVDSVFELAMIFVSCKVHHAGSWIDYMFIPINWACWDCCILDSKPAISQKQRQCAKRTLYTEERKEGRRISELPRLSPHRIYQNEWSACTCAQKHSKKMSPEDPNLSEPVATSRLFNSLCLHELIEELAMKSYFVRNSLRRTWLVTKP